MPEFEDGQLHEYLASQPSGSESESESTEFGSVGTHFWTEAEVSPCDIIPVERIQSYIDDGIVFLKYDRLG